MNRILLALVALSCLLTSCYNKGLQSRIETSSTKFEFLIQQYNHPSMNYVMVAAHRGDWRTFPENSIEAIRSAIDLGVDIVEIDLQLTKDSVLVLMHDETVDRTTNGVGKVSNLTFEEISQLKLDNGYGVDTEFGIPTLEQAIMECKGNVLVNLDKADAYIDLIYPILKKTNTFNQVIIKGEFSYEDFETKFGEMVNELNYMPKINNRIKNLDSYILSYESKINPSAYEIALNNNFKEGNVQLEQIKINKDNVWINALFPHHAMGRTDDKAYYDPDGNWGWMINKGATIIQTDRPRELINYLVEIEKH